MALLRREPALGVQCRHGTHARGRDGLAVDVVDDVARGEDAGDVGRRPVVRQQVAGLVVLELVEEELGVGVVPDRDEESLRGDLARVVALQIADTYAGDLSGVAAHDLLHDRVGDPLDLLVRTGTVEHDLRGAELVATVDDGHLGGELRQEARLLHRRVAAADDHDLLLAEEGRVADRAVGDAPALERSLRLQSELARARSGGDDHRRRPVLVVADPDAERALREVNPGHVVGQELGAEALGLLAEVLHHLRAEDAAGVAGVVLDVARDHQLAAPREPLDHERTQVGAGAVERRGVSGGAAADDDQLTYVVFGHESS